MDVDGSQRRMAAYMRDHQDKVTGRWSELVVAGLRGRRSAAERRRELDSVVATGADHAVLDITGVPTVDTEVAQHLLKTVTAARLLGAECIISGIRPQVAQTIVSLGIEFGDIVTKATLADALAHALDRSGWR